MNLSSKGLLTALNIFVTLDHNYLAPLRVMLYSLFQNNPGEHFDIYAAIDDLESQDWEELCAFCGRGGAALYPVTMDETSFADAPMVRYYPRAMYYRLLAAQVLPQDLDRVLYLDPDILIINSIRPLYSIDFQGMLYAAAMHRGIIGVSQPLNMMRLPNYEGEVYFNSGVLMMNLPLLRTQTTPEEMFAYVEKYRNKLVLPDQDILNGLYGSRILQLEEVLWNYDAKKYDSYYIASQGETNLDWTMAHTAIIHFNGKEKPWHHSYRGRYAVLYKHYMSLTRRWAQG